MPDDWSQGIISPIYKNKGDKASPDNYRGITILSCFGKLFTAVLKNKVKDLFYSYLLSQQLVLCRVAAVKSLPALIFCADYILLLVL